MPIDLSPKEEIITIEIKAIPNSLLRGHSFHCKPVEDGPIVEVNIFPTESETVVKVVCVCQARKPCSRCGLRTNNEDDHCHYWQGDGLPGGYQIIGPGMDKKLTHGWK